MSFETVLLVLYGALTVSTATCGLFFLRFWRESRDRLFFVFALAFWVLAANWLVIAFGHGELRSFLPYTLRLAAFLLIIYAVFDKNRSRKE